MKVNLLLTLLVASLASGCAFTPERPVPIQPQLQITSASVGQGHTTWVDVTDERPSTVLGTRGVAGVGSDITVDGDLRTPVRDAVIRGLEQHRFALAKDQSNTDHILKVEIRNLDYKVTMGFWVGTLRTQCALKAICMVGNTQAYEKFYRGDYQDSVMFVQSAENNERYINAAVSNAVNRLLDDSNLMKCLASSK